MSTTTKSLTAALAVTIASAGTYVGTRPTEFLITSTDGGSSCVIPDCRNRLLPSGWDERHEPVDCLSVGPLGEPDGGPRWRGCVSTDARYMVGSACLPARCSVVAGEDPLSPR